MIQGVSIRRPKWSPGRGTSPALPVALLIVNLAFGCHARVDSDDSGGSGDWPVTTDDGVASDWGNDWSDDDGNTTEPPPDLPPPLVECDIWAQDCAEGEKCTIASSLPGGGAFDITICVPIISDGALDDPCTFVDDNVDAGVDTCGPMLYCWEPDVVSGIGRCIGICKPPETNPTCEDSDAYCMVYSSGVFPVCIPSCDPFLQDCNNQLCLPNDVGQRWDCILDASGEEGQYGDPCKFFNSCDPGLFCADVDAFGTDCGEIGCCTPICDTLGDGSECTMSGQTCVSFYAEGETPWPSYENVGLCLAMP